jgi:hypothetical protein
MEGGIIMVVKQILTGLNAVIVFVAVIVGAYAGAERNQLALAAAGILSLVFLVLGFYVGFPYPFDRVLSRGIVRRR